MWQKKQGNRSYRAKNRVGKEDIRVKLKLFDTCLMTALTYGMEAWVNIRSVEIKDIQKMQSKALKRIFQLPVLTTFIGIIMERGTWPAEQKIQDDLSKHKKQWMITGRLKKYLKNKNKINIRIAFIRNIVHRERKPPLLGEAFSVCFHSTL